VLVSSCYLCLETLLVSVQIRQSVLMLQVEKRISEKCHCKQQATVFKCIWSHRYSHFIISKNFVRVNVAGFFPVLKVLIFDAVDVPDEVAPVSQSQDEDGPNGFPS